MTETDPAGILQVSADVDPDYSEGSELTYVHGVAVDADSAVPDDLDVLDQPAGTWSASYTGGDTGSCQSITITANGTIFSTEKV